MFDFLEWGEMLVETLSKIGDFLLYRPFFVMFSSFESLAIFNRFTGGSSLIDPGIFSSLASLFDFTIGELLFSGMIGLIIGAKLIKFFLK